MKKLVPHVPCKAIAMWDFSWLERRWPGAGYEDWDVALDQLQERGYDAVRIDAYPHLFAVDPNREWDTLPCWNQQVWGSPARNRVRIFPELITFLEKCAARGIMVGLSSWYQDDATHARNLIASAAQHGAQWVSVLDAIASAGLLKTILYVDLCNEWPFQCWAPFFAYDKKSEDIFLSERSQDWMREAIGVVKEHHDVPATFSLVGLPRDENLKTQPTVCEYFDFWEPHLWMVHANADEFNRRVGYEYPRWDSSGYENVVNRAEKIYRAAPDYWLGLLTHSVEEAARFSRAANKPLVTTECWGIVDYKDWPLLDWGWVKECCATGTLAAAESGCWSAIATSNFCGPQFVGMWRDVEWHQNLTAKIRSPKPHTSEQ